MTKPIRRSTAPDPEKFAVSGSEDGHQIALFCWSATPEVRQRWPELKWLFAIPNGGFRTKSQGGRLKAGGVKRGVPDTCLPIKRGRYPGLWLELKRPKSARGRAGTTSDDQDVWIEHLRSQGYACAVCVGWDEARECLISYLEHKGE